MLVIRVFCGYFSIRLGSLLVALAYMVECIVALILSAIWMCTDPASTVSILEETLAETELLYISDFLHRISKDPSPFRELALSISVCRVIICTGAIYGAYYMKPFYLLPFLLAEFIRLVLLIFLHITAMQIVKKNSQDLGLLIGATLAGTFVLCFLLYCWICVYSLFVVLRSISTKLVKHKVPLIKVEASTADEFPPRLFPAYYNNYSNPIAPVY